MFAFVVRSANVSLLRVQMEERELIKTVRGGVYPQNYEDDLRRMRKEKQEMKRLIKRLKPA